MAEPSLISGVGYDYVDNKMVCLHILNRTENRNKTVEIRIYFKFTMHPKKIGERHRNPSKYFRGSFSTGDTDKYFGINIVIYSMNMRFACINYNEKVYLAAAVLYCIFTS
jgi:hypothetical protein